MCAAQVHACARACACVCAGHQRWCATLLYLIMSHAVYAGASTCTCALHRHMHARVSSAYIQTTIDHAPSSSYAKHHCHTQTSGVRGIRRGTRPPPPPAAAMMPDRRGRRRLSRVPCTPAHTLSAQAVYPRACALRSVLAAPGPHSAQYQDDRHQHPCSAHSCARILSASLSGSTAYLRTRLRSLRTASQHLRSCGAALKFRLRGNRCFVGHFASIFRKN